MLAWTLEGLLLVPSLSLGMSLFELFLRIPLELFLDWPYGLSELFWYGPAVFGLSRGVGISLIRLRGGPSLAWASI